MEFLDRPMRPRRPIPGPAPRVPFVTALNGAIASAL
jgi:hypothetical protein